jgi:hypothetical protein
MAVGPQPAPTSDETQIALPDWAEIAEDIYCPLCNYNLRGLIEPRCPECGYRFNWPELLDQTLRLHPYAFEHHPERNIWSAWKTSWGLLRPARFWKSLHPVQPSNVTRLVNYWGHTLFATLVTLVILIASGTIQVAQWLASDALEQYKITQLLLSGPHKASFEKNCIEAFGSVTACLAHWKQLAVPNYWEGFRHALGAASEEWPLVTFMILWPMLTVVSMMVFQITMKSRRIHTTHLVRCAMYNQNIFALLNVLLIINFEQSVGLHVRLAGGHRFISFWGPLLSGSLVLVVFLIFFQRMVAACKHYLRFDRPIATIVASQIITGLAMMIILLFPLFWA